MPLDIHFRTKNKDGEEVQHIFTPSPAVIMFSLGIVIGVVGYALSKYGKLPNNEQEMPKRKAKVL